VTALYGSAGGLTATGVQLITQATPGVPSDPEPNDAFGWALAIGDMTSDGFADLAISAVSEGEWSQPFEGGLTMLLPGGPAGVTATGVTSFLGASLGLGAVGDSLAIADVDGDGDGDLVVGVPRSWIGYVVYVPGSAAGLDVPHIRVISLDTPGVPGLSQAVPTDSIQTFFGFAVATGDATGDGRADVLTGSIGYDVAGAVDAGAVFLIPGTAQGLTGAGTVMLTEAKPASPARGRPGPPAFEVPEQSDYFGHANAILNIDGTGPLDLVTATDRESPSGLIAWLGITFAAPRRPPAGLPASDPVPSRLWPIKVGTGSGFEAYNIGNTLLHR
jgi:predicted RNA-binding protein with TRAM domain